MPGLRVYPRGAEVRKAILTRNETSDQGTFGTLVTDSGFTCRTGELPWRNNESGISCIPPGCYQVVWLESPAHGWCYHVQNVSDRKDIEIHSANWMGDESKGFQCQLKGCIAPGMDIGPLEGQKACLHSKDALDGLVSDLAEQPFWLTIEGEPEPT
jgi:hypothetical protein